MTHRRYKVGVHEIYDHQFDRLKMSSAIINPEKANMRNAFKTADEKNLVSTILELKGNDKGKYYRPDARIWQTCQINQQKGVLQNIENEFVQMNQTSINTGKGALSTMPTTILEQKLRAEAELDILHEELDHCEKLLIALKEKKEPVQKGSIPKSMYMRGVGKIKDGILVELDKQRVAPDTNGVLRITDKRSIYDGLETAEYFELHAEYHKKRRKAENQARKEAKEKKIPFNEFSWTRPKLPECPAIAETEIKN